MKELIKISEQNGKQAVSARELHELLNVKKDFSDWCKRMFSYGFIENKDFTPIWGKSTGGRPSTDYALTIECAKEISMLQRTERGKQARQYFIEVEKKYNTLAPQSPLDILESSIKILREQEKRVNVIEDKVKMIEAKAKTSPDYFSIIGYASLNGIKNVTLRIAGILGKKAASICNKNGFIMDTIPDPRFGRIRTYPREVLDEVFRTPIA